jgi:hypothetical protein
MQTRAEPQADPRSKPPTPRHLADPILTRVEARILPQAERPLASLFLISRNFPFCSAARASWPPTSGVARMAQIHLRRIAFRGLRA